MASPTITSSRWVFLRGLAREAAHWGDFVNVFKKTLNAEVHCLDLPGAGRFHHVNCPLTVKEMAEFVRRQAHDEGLTEEPLNILAVSLGGMVALEWLTRYTEEISSAVMINSSLGGLSPFYRRLRWQIYGDFLQVATGNSAEEREKRILKLISHRQEAHEKISREWAEIHQLRPISPLNIARQLAAAAQYRGPQLAPTQPLLWLAGEQDRLVDCSCTYDLQIKFGGDISLHPWGGHDLTLDDGPWVAENVKQWFSRIGAPPSENSKTVQSQS